MPMTDRRMARSTAESAAPLTNSPSILIVSKLQVLEVVEGAVAGAEVVEGELHAERAQRLGEAAGRLDVGHGGGLGDLDGEAARVDAPLAQGALEGQRDRRVADRVGGQVHRQAHRGVDLDQPAEQLDAVPHDPVVDGGGEPGPLGDPDERAGDTGTSRSTRRIRASALVTRPVSRCSSGWR